MSYRVCPSKLSGTVVVPSSKSHTMRAILFASLAHGKSIIHDYLVSPDTESMIQACKFLGAAISVQTNTLEIIGTGGKISESAKLIDAGNSGQVLRFIAAAAALGNQTTMITGDESTRNNRPIKPLLSALKQLGAIAYSPKGNDKPPFLIQGPIHPRQAFINGEDSQPVSALLMATPLLAGTTEILVEHPGEKPWLSLTLSWLDRMGVSYENDNFERFVIHGGVQYQAFEYHVPGDWSSAAFPIVAAIISGSEITVENLDFDDAQGDKVIVQLLEKMGACFEKDRSKRTLKVKKCLGLKGVSIDINPCIDALPIFAVVGACAEGETHLYNAAVARRKESDRLSTVSKELTQLGVNIIEQADSLIVRQSQFKCGSVSSHKDHRIAMSLAIAGLKAPQGILVRDTDCISKSYPNFWSMLKSLGAQVEKIG